MNYRSELETLNAKEEEFTITAKSWNGKVYGSTKKGFYICTRTKQFKLTTEQAQYVHNHARDILISIHGEEKGNSLYKFSRW